MTRSHPYYIIVVNITLAKLLSHKIRHHSVSKKSNNERANVGIACQYSGINSDVFLITVINFSYIIWHIIMILHNGDPIQV